MALPGPVSPASQRALVPCRVLSGVAHRCHSQETRIASFPATKKQSLSIAG